MAITAPSHRQAALANPPTRPDDLPAPQHPAKGLDVSAAVPPLTDQLTRAAQPHLELVLRSDPRSRQELFALTGTVT